MSFRRISIIGLGLIGGSLGMALCRTNQQLRVVGYDLSARTCQEALERRAVHEIAATLPAAVAERTSLFWPFRSRRCECG